jgi:hypothetical protein
MLKQIKPTITTNCPANTAATPSQRVAEFSFPGTPGPAGGLISLSYLEDGTPVVRLSRIEGCKIFIGQTELDASGKVL